MEEEYKAQGCVLYLEPVEDRQQHVNLPGEVAGCSEDVSPPGIIIMNYETACLCHAFSDLKLWKNLLCSWVSHGNPKALSSSIHQTLPSTGSGQAENHQFKKAPRARSVCLQTSATPRRNQPNAAAAIFLKLVALILSGVTYGQQKVRLTARQCTHSVTVNFHYAG